MDKIKELQLIIGLIIKIRFEGITEAEALILKEFYKKYGYPSTGNAPANFASDGDHKLRE